MCSENGAFVQLHTFNPETNEATYAFTDPAMSFDDPLYQSLSQNNIAQPVDLNEPLPFEELANDADVFEPNEFPPFSASNSLFS